MNFIETNSGNRIHKKQLIRGAAHISIAGYTTIGESVQIQGDVLLNSAKAETPDNSKESETSQDSDDSDDDDTIITVQIGRFTHLQAKSKIIPPLLGYRRKSDGSLEKIHTMMKIGSFVIVGRNCEIRSSSIGNRVRIEDDCIVGNGCVIHSNCVIKTGSKIPDKMVIPGYSLVEGSPPNLTIQDLPGGMAKMVEQEARELYVS